MSIIYNGTEILTPVYNGTELSEVYFNGVLVYGFSSILIANSGGDYMLTQSEIGKNISLSTLRLATDNRTTIIGTLLEVEKPSVKVIVKRPVKSLSIESTVVISGVDGNLPSTDYYYYHLYLYKNEVRVAELANYIQSSAAGKTFPISYQLTDLVAGDVIELKASYGSYLSKYRARGQYNKILFKAKG